MNPYIFFLESLLLTFSFTGNMIRTINLYRTFNRFFCVAEVDSKVKNYGHIEPVEMCIVLKFIHSTTDSCFDKLSMTKGFFKSIFEANYLAL